MSILRAFWSTLTDVYGLFLILTRPKPRTRFPERKQRRLERNSRGDFAMWRWELRADGISIHDVTERYLRETRRRPTEGDPQ